MKKPTVLYYICHIDNLESILQNGILSRRQIERQSKQPTAIHDHQIVERRNKEIPGGGNLHRYANLFFQPRNAMLYRLCRNLDIEELVVLGVEASAMQSTDCFFTDRHAATEHVQFFNDIADLKQIDDSVFKKEYWTDSDDTKQRMMAEVLVPNTVPADKIITVYTATENERVLQLTAKESIEHSIQPSMFFFPTYRNRISDRVSLSQGDMFFSNLQTFTISVNLQGVMGKGLASRTKYQFPDAYVRYQDDCRSKKLKVGQPTLFKRGIRIEEELADDAALLDSTKLNGNRWFLFLATKRHWRHDSRFDDIEASMQWLLKNHKEQDIQSIALPALGCGLGNLHWKDVGPMMCYYLNQMTINSCIYLPMETDLIAEWLEPKYLLQSYKPSSTNLSFD